MKKFKTYENGKMPFEWDCIKLGGLKGAQPLLQEIRNGYTGSQAKAKGDFKISRIETISNGYIDDTRVQYASNISDDIQAKFLVKKDDILFSHINSDKHLGKTGLAEQDYEDLLHGMNLLLFRANPEVIEPAFLNYIFQYFRQQGIFIKICSRAVNQSSINQAKLKALEIPLPGKKERERIIQVLSTLQKAIQKQKVLITTIRELKKSLLHQLFTEGTKNETFKQTDIGLVPESWMVTKLGELSDVSSGGTPSREVKDFWNNGTIPWVKTGEINYCIIKNTSEKITDLGLKHSSAKVFPTGTLLMAMYGQGITRGRVSLLGIDASINQACAAIVPFSEEQVSSKYLYRYFEYHYEYIRNLGHGANQKNLSGTILKSIPIAYPVDDKEQELIYSSVDAIDNKLQLHIAKRNTYQYLFKTILSELMTGSIRVNDIDIPSVLSTVDAEDASLKTT